MHSCWEMPDDISLEADMKGQLPLSEHTLVFGRVELWNSLSKMKIYLVGHSKLSLKRNHLTGFVGLSTASRGFSCRPALVNHDESIQQLKKLFMHPNGHA